MDDESIREVIRWLNDKTHDDKVCAVDLASNVKIGMAWPYTANTPCTIKGYRFFFIYTNHETSVGAVLDMEDDLHCYVVDDFRRQGYMERALRDVILPFFAAEGRAEQRMTFHEWNDTSRALVEKLYSTHPLVRESTAGTKVEIVVKNNKAPGIGSTPKAELTALVADRLRQRIYHARNLVRFVREELALYHLDDDLLLSDLDLIHEESLFSISEDIFFKAKRRTPRP